MPKPRMAKTSMAVVHLLHNRKSACGQPIGEPPNWPAGHLWVKAERAWMISCSHCQRIHQEIANARSQ